MSEQPPWELYREPYRPQFHFTARQWEGFKLNVGRGADGWCNDPNGLVHYRGEFHLFFQRWGTAWGHAVSTDFVHWTELPPAIRQDEFGLCASGSGAVDWPNTLGLERPGEKTLLIFYTGMIHNNNVQCMASSTDAGRTWTKSPANPILRHMDRDPKVLWHEPTRRWIMVLYDRVDNENYYVFFTSADLLRWDEQSRIAGFYECPDMFQLPLDGNPADPRWVLVDGNGTYMLGDFDGRTFRPNTPKLRTDFGPNIHATQTWNDMPPADPRRVQIGWMAGSSHSNMPFNQQLTLPCELTLRTTADGPRIFRNPVRELASLRDNTNRHNTFTLAAGKPVQLASDSWDLLDIETAIDPGSASEIALNIRGERLVYDAAKRELTLRGAVAPVAPVNGVVTLRILIDRTSIEVFGNGGAASLTAFFWPDLSNHTLELSASGGTANVAALAVHALHSAWPKGIS